MSHSDALAEFQKEYISEAGFLLEQCEESFLNLERGIDKEGELAKIYRVIHTFKGAGAAVGFTDIAQFTHIVEDSLSILRLFPKLLTPEIISTLLKVSDALKTRISYLSTGGRDNWTIEELVVEVQGMRDSLKLKSNGTTNVEPIMDVKKDFNLNEVQSESKIEAKTEEKADVKTGVASGGVVPSVVKVDTERIDNVLNAVGELVVIKSQLINEIQLSAEQNSKLSGIVSLLDRTIRELQDKALSMRMMPIKNIFLKAQRIVRDLSLKLNKQVKFEMEGEDVELDRTMVDIIADPLMHLLRNSLDHGIESQDLRMAKGKPVKGLIHLKAQTVGSRILLQIKDDGAGIRRDKIIKKAIEKGFLKSEEDGKLLSDNEVFQFIFKPGFSTAELVTDVSGRGVGMDVVKTNIDKVRGTIQIESSVDLGTCFTISLPLSTSITEGLLININGHPYILALDNVIEIVDTKNIDITSMIEGGKVLCLRNKFFPLIDLRKVFTRNDDLKNKNHLERARSSLILVESKGAIFAVMMNEVYGQTQVVQKPLSNYFSDNHTSLSGAAILGDGRVALVIDVDELTKMKARNE